MVGIYASGTHSAPWYALACGRYAFAHSTHWRMVHVLPHGTNLRVVRILAQLQITQLHLGITKLGIVKLGITQLGIIFCTRSYFGLLELVKGIHRGCWTCGQAAQQPLVHPFDSIGP